MPVEFLTATQRDKLSKFPSEIPREDLVKHFSLREEDLDLIGTLQGGGSSQLGLALQIAALRYLGFVPADLTEAPGEARRFLADQIGAAPDALKRYGKRPKTKREHQVRAMKHVGFRRATGQDLGRVGDWLTERALEHDRPAVLIEVACEKLRREHLLRPGITVIERMVATAGAEAHEKSLRRLSPLLTPKRKEFLDGLLVPDSPGERTPLGWLRRPATTNSPRASGGAR